MTNPKGVIGTGTIEGTRETETTTTNSSVEMFPENRELSGKGLVKSFEILIGETKQHTKGVDLKELQLMGKVHASSWQSAKRLPIWSMT